jgi:hypothetical protein
VREMPRRTDPISLSCPKAGYCVGVDVEANAFVERAGSWTSPTGLPGDVLATSVSCATPTSCLAMGSPHDFRWNGHRWARIPGTLLAQSVSCISPSRCLAVADATNQGMWWNGHRWSKPFRLTARRDREPFRVACPGASICLVAYGDGSVNTWNGHRWSTARHVLVDLFNLACSGPRSCLATSGDQSRSWNGRSWGPTRTISTSGLVQVQALSCVTHGECVGVGNGGLMTYRAGRWSGPSPVGTDDTVQAVDCASATDCTAVAFDGTLLAGTATSLAPAGNVDRQTMATSMSCASARACVTVDSTGHARAWNGSTWGRRTRVDDVGLNSVSCPTVTRCTAVDLSGRVISDSRGVWSKPVMVDPHYAAGGQPDQLSCATPSDCALVSAGFVVNERAGVWGAPLNLDSPPTVPPAQFPLPGPLLSVSCSGPDFCAATDFSGRVFTYNGFRWSQADEIDPSAAKAFGLDHVSCSGPMNCVAESTGNAARHGGASVIRLFRYNGSTWSRVASIRGGDGLGAIGGISCPTRGRCVTSDGEIIDHAGAIRQVSIPKDGDFPGDEGGVAGITCPTRSFCAALDVDSGVSFGR